MLESSKQTLGYVLIVLITLLVIYWFFSSNPIPQDLNYHAFSDSRELFGVSNFWNVVSSVLFFIVGVVGLYKILIVRSLCLIDDIQFMYVVLFGACILIAFGSAYYHLLTDNLSLLWDRLPMSVAFMTLFMIIISEFVSLRAGKLLFVPLICAGITSVVYWYIGETQGQGDLRLYALVQFYPLLIIPVVLVFFKSRYTQVGYYWALLSVYAMSKVFEYLDREIFEYTNMISGHTIKHVFAAMSVGILLVTYQKRSKLTLS